VKRGLAWRRLRLPALAVACVSAVLFFALRPAQPSFDYVAVAVDRGEVVQRINASGKLRAMNTIKVGAEVSGQITRVFVDFNSPVHAGQILAQIDPTRLQAKVQAARAGVSAAQAQLAQALAALQRANGDLSLRGRENARFKTLSAQGFASLANADTADNMLAAARAGVQTSSAQVASARAEVDKANAELNSARLDLKRTTIVAPTTGVVINKLVEPGNTVAANFQTPNLFEIAADTEHMQLEASVDEADIGRVRDGQPVRFTVDSYPGERFHARVRQIRKAPIETQNVVSYLVILDVDNSGGKLLPGMTANIEIITARLANVTRVPTAALRFRPPSLRAGTGQPGNERSVYMPGAGQGEPVPHPITVGLQGDDFSEVRAGIKPGDAVIVRSRRTKPRGPGGTAGSSSGDGP